MIKILFLFSAILGAIAASCDSSKKTLVSSPAPGNSSGNTSTSQDISSTDNSSTSQDISSTDNSSTSQETSRIADSQDAKVTSSQIKPLGKILNAVLHEIRDNGTCLNYMKSFPGNPSNGPCPESLEVGNKKVQSKMLVACPEYGNFQSVIYDNIVIKENNVEIIKSAKVFFSIKSQDTANTVCERFTEWSVNKK